MQGSQIVNIYYDWVGNQAVEGYANSNWAQDRPKGKATTGLLFFLGGVLSWNCRKKSIVVQSSPDVKCMAVKIATGEALQNFNSAAALIGSRQHTNTRWQSKMLANFKGHCAEWKNYIHTCQIIADFGPREKLQDKIEKHVIGWRALRDYSHGTINALSSKFKITDGSF